MLRPPTSADIVLGFGERTSRWAITVQVSKGLLVWNRHSGVDRASVDGVLTGSNCEGEKENESDYGLDYVARLLTLYNKLIRLDHHLALLLEAHLSTVEADARRHVNARHALSICVAVVVDRHRDGERNMLEMREARKDIAARNKVQAVSHVDIRLLPERVEHVGASLCLRHLQTGDGDAWEGQELQRVRRQP